MRDYTHLLKQAIIRRRVIGTEGLNLSVATLEATVISIFLNVTTHN